MSDKTIINIPEATEEEMYKITEKLKNDNPFIIINSDVALFKIKDGETFEVVNDLKKVETGNLS